MASIDTQSFNARAGLVLKPLPNNALQTSAACRLGGHPNLPDGLEWPHVNGTPFHFFAQIDLGLLPRENGSETSMPEMPSHGTIFVFLCLEYCMSDVDPVILYTDHSLDGVPERMPPENTAHLLNNDLELSGMVHEDGVSEAGTSFRVQNVDVLPFNSYPSGWPIWGDWDGRQEAELEQLLGRLPSLPDPHLPPEGIDAPWMSALPERYQKNRMLAKATLNWEDLFDWAKESYMELLSLLRGAAKENGPQNINPSARPYVEELDALWEQANWTHHKYHFWLLYFQVFLSPGADYPIDYRFRHFMEIAQGCRGKVPKRVRQNFIQVIQDLEQAAQKDEMLALQPIDLPEYAHIRAKDLADAVANALRVLQPQRTGPVPRRALPKNWDEYVVHKTTLPDVVERGFRGAGMGIIPLQMFGYGYLLQDAAWKHRDDVLLLQIGDGFGTPLTTVELIQVWISPANLTAGRFDKIYATWEAT